MPRPTFEVRVNNITTWLGTVVTSLNIISDSIGTPFLDAISSTIQSLLALVQDFPSAESTCSTAPSKPISVGILPKVLNTSDHNDLLDLSPRYLWKGGDDLELAQRQLLLANLTFTVLVPPSGPVFEAINDEFTVHCLEQNIDFVAPTPASANGVIDTTPNTLPWILLGPKGRVPNRTWVEDPKGTSNFIEEGIFIFVATELSFHFVAQLPASGIYVDPSTVFLTLAPDDRIMFSLTNASLAVSFIPFSAHLVTIRVLLVALRALAILLVPLLI
ncbi:hypothetical protein DFH09DRAFT_1094576 [Mycena vulgaris]|nr:hypothetical protein DFH09DRAFT_1094576 [Mycena vulgaris]